MKKIGNVDEDTKILQNRKAFFKSMPNYDVILQRPIHCGMDSSMDH